MERKDISKKLPDTPGVYLFRKRHSRTPLYIGKATSLRDRVRSYFNKETGKTRGPAILQMLHEAEKIEVIKTDSVLEALILETELIKKYKPQYNVREKDDKSFTFIVITSEPFPKIDLVRGRALLSEDSSQYKKIFGPFPHPGELKEALKIIRKIFPWRDGKCEPNQGKPCFNKQIGLCPGVCVGEISPKEYKTLVRNIILFLSGKKKELIETLKKEMKIAVQKRDFEQAALLRDKIFALTHIHDIALLKKDRIEGVGERIEAYDVAHLGGSHAVGVMVVMEDGSFKKSDYRTFIIRGKNTFDDVGSLKEILTRRLKHNEWRYPALMVIDGGKGQKNSAEKMVNGNGLAIPVVSVVKDKHHKPRAILGAPRFIRGKKEAILLANAEAHRFAVALHTKKRGKAFGSV